MERIPTDAGNNDMTDTKLRFNLKSPLSSLDDGAQMNQESPVIQSEHSQETPDVLRMPVNSHKKNQERKASRDVSTHSHEQRVSFVSNKRDGSLYLVNEPSAPSFAVPQVNMEAEILVHDER